MIDAGDKVSSIESLTGLKRSRVFGIRKIYIEKGLEAIKSRSKNSKELLTKNQIKELFETIKNNKPKDVDEYFSECNFWTVPILAEYIKLKYDVKYRSKTSYYIIFKKVNFTYHKPGRVYDKQDPKLIKDWINKTKPLIQKALKDDNTVVLCADESLISTQTTTQKIWFEANQYPRIEVNTKRKNKSIYGFLDIKTGKVHAYATEYQTMYETEKVLKKLRLAYPKNDNKGNKVKGTKLVIIWDNAGWHKGSVVQDYIKKDGKITQYWFPRYTPELNPQEYVWKDGKEKVAKNKYIPDIEKTAKDFVDYLNKRRFHYSFLGIKP